MPDPGEADQIRNRKAKGRADGRPPAFDPEDYKARHAVERDFRHIKSDDLDLWPVFHRLGERVRAHVLICMLACYFTWHLRQAGAPLTFTDENPLQQAGQSRHPGQPLGGCPGQGVIPARPGRAAQPYRSFRGLLEHLSTLTRNQARFSGTTATVPMLTEPASTQPQAFELIGAAIPLTLK